MIDYWSKYGPNYIFKDKIIKAEENRIRGKYFKALALYDEAIISVKENNFIHEEALGYELYGMFSKDIGNEASF